MRQLTPVALTLLIGTVGGLAFSYFGFPAAFLTGSAIALTVAVILRVPVTLPGRLREPSFAILGLMVGSAVKPDTLSALSTMPLAVLGLVVAIAAAVASSFLVLHPGRRLQRAAAERDDSECGNAEGRRRGDDAEPVAPDHGPPPST